MQMTDRSNLIEIANPGSNHPKNMFQDESQERDIFGNTINRDGDTGEVEHRKLDTWHSMFPDEDTIKRLGFLDQTECDNYLKLKFPNNAQLRKGSSKISAPPAAHAHVP